MRKLTLGILVAGFVLLAGAGVGWYVLAMQDVPPSQVAIGGKTANVQLATTAGESVQLYNYAGQQGTLVIFVATRCNSVEPAPGESLESFVAVLVTQ